MMRTKPDREEAFAAQLRAAARAACSCAKSESAWYEERVKGEADTNKKPLARAMTSSDLNSSGDQKRSTAACFFVGCRYWPMVRKSTRAARRSSITRSEEHTSELQSRLQLV